jgi:hypothetical protein
MYNRRRASAALALFSIVGMCFGTAWSYMRQPRTGQRGTITIAIALLLAIIVASYRLAVTGNTTTAFDSRAPGSLNTPSSKVFFYIFNALPEWIIVSVVLIANARKTFGTGPFGQPRRDKTPAEKEQRLEREGERGDERDTRDAAAEEIALQPTGRV